MNNPKYDLIIVGSGPAGLTAGLYASRYKIKTLIIGHINGGLMTESHKICNFPTEKDITGFELGQKMAENAASQGAEIINTEVSNIVKTDSGYLVTTADNKNFEAKTVLLALGTTHRKLNLENENKFLGRGVSYCATCDGMFYKNKTVAVIGGGNSALTSALYLSDVAQKVFLIYRGSELKGEPAWIENINKTNNIEILLNTNINSFGGGTNLEYIEISNTNNEVKKIDLNGAFLEIGTEPKNYEFLGKLNIARNEGGYIKVDTSQKTSTSGIWAAGDITDASNNFRQIITACSEGSIAAEDIFKYLKK